MIRQQTLPGVSSTPPRSPTNLSPNLNAKRMAARRVSEPPSFHYPQNNNNNNTCNNNTLSDAHATNLLNSLPSPPGARKSKYANAYCFNHLSEILSEVSIVSKSKTSFSSTSSCLITFQFEAHVVRFRIEVFSCQVY